MTREEAKQVFLDRGFVNGIFDGDKWRQSIVVISEWLEQEPCEDVISLKEVIEWLKTKDIIKLSSQEETARRELKALSSIKPQEPREDCISRQAVLDGINQYIDKAQSSGVIDAFISFETLVVKELPSIQPKTGHWRAVYQGDEIINYRCTECEFGNTFGRNTHRMNFCPNCGAKMVKPQEGK